MSDYPSFDLMAFLDRDKSEPFLDEYEPRIWDDEEMYLRSLEYVRRKQEQSAGEPERQRNRIEVIEDGGFRIHADYDESFIEALKAIVPYKERIWENSTKTWFVTNSDHLPMVEQFFNMAYGWTFEDLEVSE